MTRFLWVAPDTYAIFNDDRKTVYFEHHASASRVIQGKQPPDFVPPDGYEIVPFAGRWPKASTAWVV